MKKYLLFAAASFAFSTAAHAGSAHGSLNDTDGSDGHVTFSSNTPDMSGEDYGSPVIATFSISGTVPATCSIYGVDSNERLGSSGQGSSGLNGSINLGQIGITAGDELTASQLFNMAGPASANIHSNGAGCNAKNVVTVTKSANGLVNANPGVYDSDQFVANIPYAADVSFKGRLISQNTGPGTVQHVNAGTSSASATGAFGAWRSALDVDLTIPAVSGKGLVAGTYADTLTVTIALN